MAENLRYVPDEALLTKGIWYPDGNEDAEYVREHGMLYSFTAALGGAQAVSGAPVRGICPEGWHVPYIDELQTLAVGPDCGFTLAGMWNSVSKNYVSSAKSGYLMSAATDDREAATVRCCSMRPAAIRRLHRCRRVTEFRFAA